LCPTSPCSFLPLEGETRQPIKTERKNAKKTGKCRENSNRKQTINVDRQTRQIFQLGVPKRLGRGVGGIGLTQPQHKPDPPFYDFSPTHLSTRINLFLGHGREVSEDIIKTVRGMDIVTDLSQKSWSRDNESSPSDLSAQSVLSRSRMPCQCQGPH
jgi:hypothetical protein